MKSKMIGGIAQRLAEVFVRYPKLFVFCVIIYVISPVDLLPEGLLGPIGYLDDFVVILLPFLLKAYARKWLPPKNVVETTARKL